MQQRYGTFDNFKASVKYLARKKILADLIEELRQNNETLRTLHQLADTAQAGRNMETPTKRITGLVRHFETIRQTALSLHQTLADHIHCSKHPRHSVKLELGDRDIETLSGGNLHRANDEEMIRFRIIFTAHIDAAGDEVALRVFEMELAKEAIVSIDNRKGSTGSTIPASNNNKLTVGVELTR